MPRAALSLSSLIVSILLLICGNAYLMTLLAGWTLSQGGWNPEVATEEQETFYTHLPEASVD